MSLYNAVMGLVLLSSDVIGDTATTTTEAADTKIQNEIPNGTSNGSTPVTFDGDDFATEFPDSVPETDDNSSVASTGTSEPVLDDEYFNDVFTANPDNSGSYPEVPDDDPVDPDYFYNFTDPVQDVEFYPNTHFESSGGEGMGYYPDSNLSDTSDILNWVLLFADTLVQYVFDDNATNISYYDYIEKVHELQDETDSNYEYQMEFIQQLDQELMQSGGVVNNTNFNGTEVVDSSSTLEFETKMITKDQVMAIMKRYTDGMNAGIAPGDVKMEIGHTFNGTVNQTVLTNIIDDESSAGVITKFTMVIVGVFIICLQ